MEEENFEKVEFMNSEQDLMNAMAVDTGNEPAQPETQVEQQVEQPQDTPYVDPEAAPVENQEVQETPEPQNTDQEEYSPEDVEGAILEYMSERLGTKIESFDYFNESSDSSVDERIEAIAKFVQDTGRAPEDWFRYQQLNPSEMDDATAIRVTTANQYPNLSYEEINMLMANKYKLNPDQHSEDEIKMSQLQMKIDGDNARSALDNIRNEYAAPQKQEQESQESFINEAWLSTLDEEVDSLEGLEFDLGNGNAFTFGLDDQAKNNLMQSNAYIDEFFDGYVDESGSWDFDKLNSHMAVLQNIDSIVSAAYKQGMGDGQRGLVNKASNVSVESPQTNGIQGDENLVSDQLRQIMGGGNTLTFNI